ncbi:hypothetical protein NC651_039075 [Populus alba x Populus x berolinensis]|nr:hypothetical protein NC651_039075 [Populus alba x Populus x berolinensis]
MTRTTFKHDCVSLICFHAENTNKEDRWGDSGVVDETAMGMEIAQYGFMLALHMQENYPAWHTALRFATASHF